MLGKAAYSEENYSLARSCFSELIPLVNKIPKEYSYNALSLNLHLAEIDFETGKYSDVRGRCDSIALV
jgi:hypothetical protein